MTSERGQHVRSMLSRFQSGQRAGRAAADAGAPAAAGGSVTFIPNGDRELDWLVGSFTNRIPGVTSVVVLSTDGLVLAVSERLDRDLADTLAAVASGLVSLTAGAARHCGTGPVNQVIVEMDGGYLFVTTISEGSALAVMSGVDADIGLIGYEMSVLVAHRPGAHAGAPRGVVGATRAMIRGGWRSGRPTGRARVRPHRRSRPVAGLDLNIETLVSTTQEGMMSLAHLRFEQARIVELCRRPVSVAEVAAELAVPLGVARVLVSDLHAEHMCDPPARPRAARGPRSSSACSAG